MRDIPLFTTENGIASLLLKKIPYTKEAYVHIRDSISCMKLLKECVDICRMAGADTVHATGHDDLAGYPEYCAVYRYKVLKEDLPATEAIVVPISTEQKAWWRQIYNSKMAQVPGAAPLSDSDLDQLITENKAFCIYKGCSAIGIGVAYAGEIQAIASVTPGGGWDSVIALAKSLSSEYVSLTVASTNRKAICLYKSLGFLETETEAVWYKIFDVLRKNA